VRALSDALAAVLPGIRARVTGDAPAASRSAAG
jgi:hypothetical protein